MSNPFQNRQPVVNENDRIRVPQQEAFNALMSYNSDLEETDREIGIVLPVGCGKSGCITLAPFAFGSKKTLVIAPSVSIAEQLEADFNPTNSEMFYQKCNVLDCGPYPEPVEIRGTTTNRGDLDEAHVVITNIHQLQGGANKWLTTLPTNYFDLIIFDEGHHSVAESWEIVKSCFPDAKIINFSATPLRADGQVMAGKIIYSYPIFRAIQEGYVKRLKAVQLNPRTLRYIRRENSQEIEVGLDEVRRLGETEADFRRSIVTSSETLNTIVDASIRELERLRNETGENRLKIIASALNYEHCRQIVEAYISRGKRAGYVHSRAESKANKIVMEKLDNHELDVIVQVRKLGEGFNHIYLSVAAIFSIFSNLSPFIQFVGRIMRVIKQNEPGHILNQGVVIFHAGANIACQWADFQEYSEADQDYFDQLLPLEGVDPADPRNYDEISPVIRHHNELKVRSQSEVLLQELPLLKEDETAAIRLLQERGIIAADFDPASQILQPVPTTRVAQRQAKRVGLDMRVRTEAARILSQRSLNPAGRDLDRNHLNRDNLIVMKAAIDRQINTTVGRNAGQRHEFTRQELDLVDTNFLEILEAAIREVFNVN